jgi:RNA polymerase sigma factor (TIGR02999 family)
LTQAGEVTVLLRQLAGGDRQALEDLVPLVYDQLRVIARRQMANEPAGHTLNATAVIHEAYLRIAELDRIEWGDRAHFFAVASQAMRRVLVNYANRRNTLKRGGDRRRVELDDFADAEGLDAETLMALDHALHRLEAVDERQVRVVECRFFGALSIEETAAALDVSIATVKRDWAMARAWLNRELSDG